MEHVLCMQENLRTMTWNPWRKIRNWSACVQECQEKIAWLVFWLVIEVLGTWQVYYRFFVDISSLLVRWYLFPDNLQMCCKPFFKNLSIILKELLGFSSFVFGGFSHDKYCLMWMNVLCGWFTYEIHMCSDWLIKILRIKYLHYFSKY